MTVNARESIEQTCSIMGGESPLNRPVPTSGEQGEHDSPMLRGVQLRAWPYPYRAMMAICSDLDETPNRQAYWDTTEFLNTTRTTSMGTGVGLEVGNTIYFDMPDDQFAYWNTDDAGRAMVQELIRSGHIDCLHSFGDLATTREHAQRALDELHNNGCHLEVWIDHAQAVTNFDGGIMMGQGDVASAPTYHADLTIPHGVQFVWRGHVTSVLGQDVTPRLGGLWSSEHPFASTKTVAKEWTKQVLGCLGHARYARHAPNRILTRSTLRDDQGVYEFLRCNPHWGGVSSNDTARGIGDVLTTAMLDQLVEREGGCVLYTHLGKAEPNSPVPLGPSAVEAFRRLASAQDAGDILVTTTRRLLGYSRAKQEIKFSAKQLEDGIVIEIDSVSNRYASLLPLSEADLEGLTFYTPMPERTGIVVDGTPVRGVVVNAPDATGSGSVSISWTRLEFPER